MAGQIEDNEQIAREKRRLDRTQFARVADGLAPFWQKRPEGLVAQMPLGIRLAQRQGMDGIPPLPIGERRRAQARALKILRVWGSTWHTLW
jgi:hypothetical protein